MMGHFLNQTMDTLRPGEFFGQLILIPFSLFWFLIWLCISIDIRETKNIVGFIHFTSLATQGLFAVVVVLFVFDSPEIANHA